MRVLAIAVFLSLQTASIAKQQRELPENAMWTYLLFAYVVGDYYAAHRAWPETTQQLRAHSTRIAAKELPAADRNGMKKLWARFTRVELKPRGKDLLVIARFRADEGRFDYNAIYHPGRSADEIIQAITPQ